MYIIFVTINRNDNGNNNNNDDDDDDDDNNNYDNYIHLIKNKVKIFNYLKSCLIKC